MFVWCLCVCPLCVHHMCQYPYFRMHNYNVYRSSAIYDVTVKTFKAYWSHNSLMFSFSCVCLFFSDMPKLVLVSALFWCVWAVNTAIIRWYNLCSRSPLCVHLQLFLSPPCAMPGLQTKAQQKRLSSVPGLRGIVREGERKGEEILV